MASQPQLSIVLVTRNNADQVEEPFNQLLQFDQVPCELIIIDDASTDNSPEIINSLLENAGQSNAFFFPFEEYRSRGNALNFALEQINTPYLWIVDRFDGLDTGFLKDALEKLRQTETPVFYAGKPKLPDDLHGLIRDHDTLLSSVDDRDFVWKWFDLPANERFFNPFWYTRHALEVAIRVSGQVEIIHAETGADDNPFTPTPLMRRNYFKSLLNHPDLTTALREEIFRAIRDQDEVVLDEKRNSWIEEQYQRALNLIEDGSPRAALDTLNAILELDPQNPKVEDLKFKVLNRMNRYVEAAEIKHRKERKHASDASDTDAATDTPEESPKEYETESPKDDSTESASTDDVSESKPAGETEDYSHHPITLIIPTAGSGLNYLEQCLESINQHCNPDYTRLIIVDNASLDDTYEYIKQLKERNFLQLKVVTNSRNHGFGASVNQALEHVETPFVCVMHNDVTLSDDTPGKLADLLNRTDYDLLGPTTGQTMIETQFQRESPSTEIEEARHIDSFMMVFYKDTNAGFDEMYGPAFFDNLDFCNQIYENNGKCGIACNHYVDHTGGAFLASFGLFPNSKEFLKNESYYNRKWNLEPQIPEDFHQHDPLTQLALIGEVINVFYPEKHLADYIDGLLTSEVRTELMQSEFSGEALNALIRVMVAVNERELLRKFEDQLAGFEIDEELYYILIQFYYDNNIYSRCKKYLDALEGDELFIFSYFRLRIAVAERNMSQSVSLLNKLMDVYPDHPGLLKLAGDIQLHSGNEEEADKFYILAAQIDPFRFPNKQVSGS